MIEPRAIDDLGGQDVSVMVCAYNAAATLGSALASIAAQSVPPGAVIVVDDGSTDDTSAVAVGWASRVPIELIRLPENRGQPHARVVAQGHCRRPLVAMLDADDAWLPDHLETLLATYRKAPGIVVARELLWVRGSGVALADGRAREVPNARRQLHHLLRADFLPIATLFARADLERAGGFRDVRPEDWDLWIRMVRAGVLVSAADHATYLYQVHARSVSFGDKLAASNADLLARAAREAVSARERRVARRSLVAARAQLALATAFQSGDGGDARGARRHACRALLGRPRTSVRALFVLVTPRTAGRVHARRVLDIDRRLGS